MKKKKKKIPQIFQWKIAVAFFMGLTRNFHCIKEFTMGVHKRRGSEIFWSLRGGIFAILFLNHPPYKCLWIVPKLHRCLKPRMKHEPCDMTDHSDDVKCQVSIGLFQIINFALPPPRMDVALVYRMQKVWNSTGYFTIFSWKSELRRWKSLDFWVPVFFVCLFACLLVCLFVLFFLEMRVKTMIFVKNEQTKQNKKPGNPGFYFKIILEIQPPLWGGGASFFFFFSGIAHFQHWSMNVTLHRQLVNLIWINRVMKNMTNIVCS